MSNSNMNNTNKLPAGKFAHALYVMKELRLQISAGACCLVERDFFRVALKV